MKVNYHGYYGAKNSGDDAFVEVASWGAAKYWGAADHLFFSGSLPEIITEVSYYPPHKNYFNFLKTIRKVILSDVFVSAGGSTFHSRLKLTDLRSYAKYKKNTFGSAGAIGISLGPYKDARAETHTKSYLEKLNFLALRDRYSYDLALSYNLPYKPILAFDLAALLPEVYNEAGKTLIDNTTTRKKTVGISLCNYERYIGGDLTKEKKRNSYILEVLEQLTDDREITFRFFIFNGNPVSGDAELTKDIIEKLSKKEHFNYEIIPYLSNVYETWKKINECNLVFSVRLHAAIFACFGNTPFFLLEYHRKCRDLLDDIGQHNHYRILDGEKEPAVLAHSMLRILNDRSEYINPLHIGQVTERALRNFTETYQKK